MTKSQPGKLRGDLAHWMRIARQQRWTVRQVSGGHFRWESPDGAVVMTPSTPGRGRSQANTRANLERAGLLLRTTAPKLRERSYVNTAPTFDDVVIPRPPAHVPQSAPPRVPRPVRPPPTVTRRLCRLFGDTPGRVWTYAEVAEQLDVEERVVRRFLPAARAAVGEDHLVCLGDYVGYDADVLRAQLFGRR